jgi:RES domain-containing protein
MRVFRLTKARYADLSGSGGMVRQGRWHTRGRPVVYCGGSRALCALETLVHLDVDERRAPIDYVCLEIDVPDDLAREGVSLESLPADWAKGAGGRRCRALGDHWLTAGGSVALVVPSAVIPREPNVLLNPRHPDMARVRIIGAAPFAFDGRLLRGTGNVGS